MHPLTDERTPLIYVATPWGALGGGMYKVADYLIQAQTVARAQSEGAAELRGLDTRGNGSAAMSIMFLLRALWFLIQGRINGRLAGVHVNMAERLSVVRKGVLIAACRLLGIPVVLHLHAAQLPQFYQQLPRGLKGLLRWVFSLPDVCIVLGASAQRFVAEELKVPPSRIAIVINGVPEPVVPRRVVSPDRPQRILFLGNLTERKGVSDFMHALARLDLDTTRCCVQLAGGGDVEAYQSKARQLGIEDLVHFEGWADQAKVAQLLANADILILPSYDEGLPLVILEALANGVAVVCTPVGEIPNVLTDGLNVAMVPPGDIDGIAAGLREILGKPEVRQKYERNGRKIYEQKFSVATFFDCVADIHKRCFGVCATRAKSLVVSSKSPS